ncbi:MAG TPA: rhomboid family intramembrane serine protease [Bacteroidales bacterium]|nr:rhomboid family intramembrane serine protease [Bacteroidales bacterium]
MALKDLPVEKKKVWLSIIFPAFFVALLWLIKAIEVIENNDLWYYGIYPRSIKGIPGIILSPLIHGNINHLLDNSIPLFFLAWAVFYFYNKVSYRVFFIIYFFSGVAVWIFARPSYHIGASGLIYGLGSFLFFSGIIRQNINLLAISLLVTFLYGSMVWGIFPYRQGVSWESHLAGGTAGFLLSIIYRKIGPKPTVHVWNEEDEEDEENYWMDNNQELPEDKDKNIKKQDEQTK